MTASLQIIFLALFLTALSFVIYRKKKMRRRSFMRNDFVRSAQTSGMEAEDGLAVDQDELGVVSCVKSIKIEPAPAVKNKAFKQPSGFIVIRLMAPKGTSYVGYELMQALLSAGLRYGSRNIFHYYEEGAGKPRTLFSLASAVEPGTFELSQMGSIACPGLTLFMEYSNASSTDPLHALTLMLDVARQLSEDLGGQIFTANAKPLTEMDIKQWRMQLASYQQQEMGDLLTTV